MKVTLINTFHLSGGAAVACRRLWQALRKNNVQAELLVQEKTVLDPEVTAQAATFLQKKGAFLRFAADRLHFSFYEKNKQVRFAFSPASIGTDISRHPLIMEADILHLHWITFGFLSLHSIEQLFALNKPIVWTLHDMWAFTGGCHYSGTCSRYTTHCHSCPFLRNPHPKDLSYRIFEKKIQLFAGKNLTLVPCSNWLGKLARQSYLFRSMTIQPIPNPIDISQYKLVEKNIALQVFNLTAGKKYLLFGAMNITDPRKGFTLLKQALEILHADYPETREKVALLVFGKTAGEAFTSLPFPVHNLGKLSSTTQLVNAYNAAGVFVLPSLEDNLPNTVMEAMACGTPVLAFEAGGIPEMVDHLQNGYLAEYGNAQDLAKGIHHLLFRSDLLEMGKNARQKVLATYTEDIIAAKYRQVYEQLLV